MTFPAESSWIAAKRGGEQLEAKGPPAKCLFANVRGTGIKLLVHDGFSVWCATRRLNVERFVWPRAASTSGALSLTPEQFDALVLNLRHGSA